MLFPFGARPVLLKTIVALGAAVVAAGLATKAHARIGDTEAQMDARILQPGLGKNFSWPKDMRRGELERIQREMPTGPFAYLLPGEADGWREQIFWKTAVRGQMSGGDGWRVHVYYLKGRSVLELYKREGAKLNEFEVNGLLAVVRGGQAWRKVEGKKDPKAAGDTVIGYDFELGDDGEGTVRAKQQGDWLMIFHKRFDDYLIERKARWDANEDLRKAEERTRNQQTAPASLEGF